MKQLRGSRLPSAMLVVAFLFSVIAIPSGALAGTTGNITGVVSDTSGRPVADVRVTASSPSQSAAVTTDARGFYSVVNLTPDTYTLSFQKSGYSSASVPGVVVFQDQTVTANQTLTPEIKTIASVTSKGASNLVQPNQGSDVYNVSSQEMSAATNPVMSLSTVYNFLAVTPGVTTPIGSQPRIRGGQVTDLGYEFEGIPIQDDIVGFFTSNLSNVGLQNVEVYTGGLAGAGAVNGTGYFNSVLKSGTYPGSSSLGFQASTPEANQYLSFEDGGATPDHKYSWYVGFNGVNSTNQYDYGEHTFPGVVFCCDGPGTVRERNWVGNFFYRPNAKNTIQVVATNDLGEFDFSYLLTRKSGEPLPLAYAPCAGAVSSWSPGAAGNFPNNSGGFTTGTFATGGTAANGQPCPLGIQWSPLGSGQGNFWHHYGGLGKVQWNHDFNEHSFLNFRVDDNYNEYIFDQPMSDPNLPGIENEGDPYSWTDAIGIPGGCPAYPYSAGTPVQNPAGDPYDQCAWVDGAESTWDNRRSNIWQLAADYTNALNDHITLKAGVSDQFNKNRLDYYATDTFVILPNGTATGAAKWPGLHEISDVNTNEPIAYFDPEFHFGKWMVNPGITYAQRHYAFPADTGYIGQTAPSGATVTANDIYSGGFTAKAWDPTLNGTYTFSPNDVLTFSFGDTTNFIASAYVYTSSAALYSGFDAGTDTRDPFVPGTTFAPQQNHSAELMWEHNFGNGITMRVGPYHNSTNNYYAEYNPLLGYFNSGCSNTAISGCTPCSLGGSNCVPVFSKGTILSNNNATEDTGAEFALNRVDNAPRGTSFWLSLTYDNYWDTSGDISGAYINFPLPQNIINQGIKVRATSNPLWSFTGLVDFHSNGFHLDPIVSYQGDTFFNTGVVFTPTDSNGNPTGPPYISENEQTAHGWWTANLMAYKEFGSKRQLVLGVNVQNLFDNTTDIYPCFSGGTGCSPFNGPQSGIANQTGLIYQNYSQTPRTFYFFAGLKM